MKKRGWTALLLLSWMLNMSACANMGGQAKAQIPERPRISNAYETLLRTCPVETQKEAMKHEWDWHGWADKMEERTK